MREAKSADFFIYKIKCTTRVSPWGILGEINSIGMFDVVVSILKILKFLKDQQILGDTMRGRNKSFHRLLSLMDRT